MGWVQPAAVTALEQASQSHVRYPHWSIIKFNTSRCKRNSTISLYRAVSLHRQQREKTARWRRLPGVLILVFGVDFVVDPLARSAAVWYKSFVFSSLPIRKVLVCLLRGALALPLPVVSLLFSVSYPQARRSYYLFFNYLFFNYL